MNETLLIKVTPDVRRQLMQEFGMSDRAVYDALGYETNSYAAKEMRKRARELGGTLLRIAEIEWPDDEQDKGA